MCSTSNEKKMSDGGRERASIGVEVLNSSEKWNAQRSAVRSIAWLDAVRGNLEIRHWSNTEFNVLLRTKFLKVSDRKNERVRLVSRLVPGAKGDRCAGR